MSDQQELNSILGGRDSNASSDKKSRNRPHAKHRKGSRTQRTTEQIIEKREITEQVILSEIAVDMQTTTSTTEPVITEMTGMTVATYADRVEIMPSDVEVKIEHPAQETSVTPVEPQETVATEPQPEIELELVPMDKETYPFRSVADAFSRVQQERTWRELGSSFIDLFRGGACISEPFRGMARLKDLERPTELRMYQFIGLVQHLGRSTIGAVVSVVNAQTYMKFGFDNDEVELVIDEVDDTFRMFFVYNEATDVGKVMAQKVGNNETLTHERLDDAIQALDAALDMYHTRLLARPEVKQIVMDHVKTMM